MDMRFFLRAERMLGERPLATLDYGVLVATLTAHQARSRTAKIQSAAPAASAAPADPLVELILGGSAWRAAAAAQGGCFNRALAVRAVNGS